MTGPVTVSITRHAASDHDDQMLAAAEGFVEEARHEPGSGDVQHLRRGSA